MQRIIFEKTIAKIYEILQDMHYRELVFNVTTKKYIITFNQYKIINDEFVVLNYKGEKFPLRLKDIKNIGYNAYR